MENELVVKLTAVICTLAEVGSSPESICYLGVNCTMDEWTSIRFYLQSAELATFDYNLVTLTAKGLTLADKLNAAMATKATKAK